VSEANATPWLPVRWISLVIEAQPFESLQGFLMIFLRLEFLPFKTKEILTHDEEGNKEYQRLACLPVQLHICGVNNEEEHESKISEVVQILGSIYEQAYQYKSLNMLQKEEQEFVDS
jgi:hypothetical protein